MNGETVCEKDFSMRDYLLSISTVASIQRPDYREFAIALLRYGAAAQLALDYKTDNLVNEGTHTITYSDGYEYSFDVQEI